MSTAVFASSRRLLLGIIAHVLWFLSEHSWTSVEKGRLKTCFELSLRPWFPWLSDLTRGHTSLTVHYRVVDAPNPRAFVRWKRVLAEMHMGMGEDRDMWHQMNWRVWFLIVCFLSQLGLRFKSWKGWNRKLLYSKQLNLFLADLTLWPCNLTRPNQVTRVWFGNVGSLSYFGHVHWILAISLIQW